MKKLILIISAMILILLSDNVKALTLDGTFDREVYPFSTEKSLVQLYNTDNKTLNFNTTFNTGDDDYVVIPMTGMVFIQEDTSSSGTSLKLRDVYPYLHVYLITNKNWTACEFQNNFIVCPVKHDSVARAIAFDSFQFSEYTSSDLSVEIQIYYNFNLYKKDSTQMITEQQQTNDKLDDFLETNQTYSQEQNTNIKGVNETMQFEQAEGQLIDSLDMNTSILDEISINPNANVFIWNIVDAMRSINPAIILLMTSMLGLGVIKLVLNR